ncbi:MAG: DUF1385 domain-containing protein [Parasporobacterium sp.]|nr:DUF1385 domain-containing protein [Lachnospiraceae bacterium]MBR3642870.1 DUF1385 domain-containing protein [Parasporobacterium sp.]
MKSSNIGGQAVIEGVMMRHDEDIAVAVRRPDGQIEVGKSKFENPAKKYKFLGWPIIRGVVSFIMSLILGIRTLTYSASFYEDDIEKEHGKTDQVIDSTFKSKGESAVMVFTVFVSLVIAIALFIVLPYVISMLILKFTNITSSLLLAVIEGVIKLAIFIGYIALISKMKDIKRTFMYHGAEHKCINCLESGHELTVANVMKASKEHRRCGTSFIFFVLFISIIFFIFIRVDSVFLRLLIRLLLIPVIAGVSYEFIRWAGNSDSKLAAILSRPGLLMQGLTTKEPTREMVEVGIASVEAVFDWRSYLEGLDDLFETEEIKVQEKRKSIQEVIAEPEKAKQKGTKVSSEKADEETMKWL